MYNEHQREFQKVFEDISRNYGEYTVFYDFVKMCAISIYNAFAKDQNFENEYLNIINNYEKEEQEKFVKLFALLIMMFEDSKDDLTDVLGPFYEKEHMGNSHLGQFFTPSHVSDLMAEVAIEEGDKLQKIIEEKGYITMQEPTCGAGRYGTFICKSIKKEKY